MSNLVGPGSAVLIMGDFVRARDAKAGIPRRLIVHTIQESARVSRGARPPSSSIMRKRRHGRRLAGRSGLGLYRAGPFGLAHLGWFRVGPYLNPIYRPDGEAIRGG
jgi:hypothetical protein